MIKDHQPTIRDRVTSLFHKSNKKGNNIANHAYFGVEPLPSQYCEGCNSKKLLKTDTLCFDCSEIVQAYYSIFVKRRAVQFLRIIQKNAKKLNVIELLIQEINEIRYNAKFTENNHFIIGKNKQDRWNTYLTLIKNHLNDPKRTTFPHTFVIRYNYEISLNMYFPPDHLNYCQEDIGKITENKLNFLKAPEIETDFAKFWLRIFHQEITTRINNYKKNKKLFHNWRPKTKVIFILDEAQHFFRPNSDAIDINLAKQLQEFIFFFNHKINRSNFQVIFGFESKDQVPNELLESGNFTQNGLITPEILGFQHPISNNKLISLTNELLTVLK